jgi:hypothetical protein
MTTGKDDNNGKDNDSKDDSNDGKDNNNDRDNGNSGGSGISAGGNKGNVRLVAVLCRVLVVWRLCWLPYLQNHITGNAPYGTGNATHTGNVSCPHQYCTLLYFMFF